MSDDSHKHEWMAFTQETTACAPTMQRCKCGAVRCCVGSDTATASGHRVYQATIVYGHP